MLLIFDLNYGQFNSSGLHDYISAFLICQVTVKPARYMYPSSGGKRNNTNTAYVLMKQDGAVGCGQKRQIN